MLQIISAHTQAHYQYVRELIAELIAWDSAQTSRVGLDVQELLAYEYGQHGQGDEALSGDYAPPSGCLLLAIDGEEPAGCGAFRRLSAGVCEMKRMYVRPRFRGQHIGRRLAVALIATAREAGYKTMQLETATFMHGALALYSSLGFRTREPYYSIPARFSAITVFMELDLLD